MTRDQLEQAIKLADEIGTARVQRFVAYTTTPEDDDRHRAAEARVKLMRDKLRALLERV